MLCVSTNKFCYQTITSALWAFRRMRITSRRKMNIYGCLSCAQFHLGRSKVLSRTRKNQLKSIFAPLAVGPYRESE